MTTHTRDSEKTKKAILDALESILTTEGFTGVGINAVARKAGVDKVLIYRYFDSMEGLLKAFRDRHDLCPRVLDVVDEFPPGTPVSKIVTRILTKTAKAFRENELAQELARWELTEKNPLTVAYSRSLEQTELKALHDRGIVPGRDTVLAVTLLLSGIHYLTLRQSIRNPMMDIDMNDPEVVRCLDRVLKEMVERYFSGREEIPYAQKK